MEPRIRPDLEKVSSRQGDDCHERVLTRPNRYRNCGRGGGMGSTIDLPFGLSGRCLRALRELNAVVSSIGPGGRSPGASVRDVSPYGGLPKVRRRMRTGSHCRAIEAIAAKGCGGEAL
jgi:hypothetical protein